MTKIFEILNKKQVKGDIGIEIEAEGRNLPANDFKYWSVEDDGSLRGVFPGSRAEFVIKAPVRINQVKEALKELFDKGVENGTEWRFSFRCSTHVHLNVLDLEEEELFALVYTYLLLEEPLVRYCGRERIHNRFALRTQDAEQTLEYIHYLLSEGPASVILRNGNQIRYAGLNLAALQKYGSLEFRSMRGTNDQGVLNNWIEAIYCLKKFCKEKTLQQVKQMFIELDSEAFAKEVLGDLYKVFKYVKLPYDMRFSFSLSLPLCYVERKAVKKKQPLDPLIDRLDQLFEAQQLRDGYVILAPVPNR